MSTKKRDDEKLITVIVCGIFSAVLAIILFTAGNIGAMSFFLKVATFALVGATALCWIVLLKNFGNPNYDYWRWLCILFAIAGIVVIMLHRSGWLDEKEFKNDVEKVKQSSVLMVDENGNLFIPTAHGHNIDNPALCRDCYPR